MAHMGAARGASRRREQHPGAGALDEGGLVGGPGRVPEGGDLAHAEDAAGAEEAGSGRLQHRRGGGDGSDAAGPEARAGGVVVVAVGGHNAVEQFRRALGPGLRGQDGRHLELGLEGNPGDLFLDEGGVVDAVAAALPAPPEPGPRHGGGEHTGAQERRLEGFAALHPVPALEGDEPDHAEDGEGEAVRSSRLGLGGRRGGHRTLLDSRLVGELLVGLRPVGAEGTQQQPGHDALAGPQGGERPEQGDKGVGARIKKIVVAEGAQGHVLGSARPEGQAPGLLTLGRDAADPPPRRAPRSGPGGSGRRSGRVRPRRRGSGP